MAINSFARLFLLVFLYSTLHGYGQVIDLAKDQLTGPCFNPSAVLKVANQLIVVGDDVAYNSLTTYYKQSLDRSKHSKYDEYVAWLCLLVYEPKPQSSLETPLFGYPQFPYFRKDHREHFIWPQFPLVIVRNVPFDLVVGWPLAGQENPASYYIDLYHKQGIFRTHPYSIPTRADAVISLKELISSSRWRESDWQTAPYPGEAGVIEFLKQQVDSISP